MGPASRRAPFPVEHGRLRWDHSRERKLEFLKNLTRQPQGAPSVRLTYQISAEAALRRRGRTEVRLEITGEDGTEWMSLVPPAPGMRRPQQLRLF